MEPVPPGGPVALLRCPEHRCRSQLWGASKVPPLVTELNRDSWDMQFWVGVSPAGLLVTDPMNQLLEPL